MFFIGGVLDKVKTAGSVPDIQCPVCGCTTELHVTVKYMTPHLFFIPTFRFGLVYLGTCGHCASVMKLPVEYGKQLERTGESTLKPWELEVLRNNQAGRCTSCGNRMTSAQNYCPNCGASAPQNSDS